jgi:hypothetical protein
LLNLEEKQILEDEMQLNDKSSPPYWMPLLWVGSLFETARSENRIDDDTALGHVGNELIKFREKCSNTLQVDLIGIPLAYSQV